MSSSIAYLVALAADYFDLPSIKFVNEIYSGNNPFTLTTFI